VSSIEPKLVSVVIVNKNYDQFIRSAVESVLNQTHPYVEVIVVDDHSTDSSLRIVEEYRKDGRLSLTKSRGNGVSAARNEGLRLAKGDYVAFLDSDDFFERSKIELQLKLISQENLDGVTNDVLLKGTSSISDDLESDRVSKMDFLSFQKSALGVGGYLMSTLLIKRSILEKIDWFDEVLSHGEDYDFASRVFRGFRIGHLPQCMTTIRKHATNSSNAPSNKYQADVRHIANKFLRENSFSMSRLQILQYIIRSTFGSLKYSIKSKSFTGAKDSLAIVMNLSFAYGKRRSSV
jgi:glycosyltransferase involved in cell wall biosynthesis